MRQAAIGFLRWVALQHWTVKVLFLMVLIIPVGGPVSVCPPLGRWWDALIDEAYHR